MTSVATITGVLLAHQGGWDEILMVAGPVLLMWLILRMANKRAHRMADAAGDAAVDASADAAASADRPVKTTEEPAGDGLSRRGGPSRRDR